MDPPGQVPDEWTVETISLMHGQATVTLGCNGDRLKVRRTLDDARALARSLLDPQQSDVQLGGASVTARSRRSCARRC